jgi:Tfp pilus assembly protein PilP
MKKVLIMLLVIVALPLYSYNAFLLIRISFGGNEGTTRNVEQSSKYTFEELIKAATPVVFAERGRDPFTLHKKKNKPKQHQKKKVAIKKETKKTAPPPLVLSGVLWKPDNPVAMVKMSGGSTKLVKVGQAVGGNITVKKIEKKSVTVVYEGEEFTIKK